MNALLTILKALIPTLLDWLMSRVITPFLKKLKIQNERREDERDNEPKGKDHETSKPDNTDDTFDSLP